MSTHFTTLSGNDLNILHGTFGSTEHKYWVLKNVHDDKAVSDYLIANDIDGDKLFSDGFPNWGTTEKIAAELGMLTEDVYYALRRRCYRPRQIAVRAILAEHGAI